ncbi:MAG: hypothetical protein LBG30_04060 [Odoribacteraceae bacterium]|jgi:hypothetical protein|nr:hypothetical protein [Odoribacteraceae bacterium]
MEKSFLPFEKNQSFSFSPTPFNMTFDKDLLITQQYDYNVYSFSQDSIKTLFKLDFNTKDKIPDNFQDVGFEKLRQDLMQQSVVKRVEYINKIRDYFYMTFIYEYTPHLVKIAPSKNTAHVLKLEYNNKFPFVFAQAVGFHDNYLVGYLHASSVLLFDNKFPSDKTPSGLLNADDNPVLFFHRLKTPN